MCIWFYLFLFLFLQRYENEIAALKASEAALTENLAILKTEKTKNEL